MYILGCFLLIYLKEYLLQSITPPKQSITLWLVGAGWIDTSVSALDGCSLHKWGAQTLCTHCWCPRFWLLPKKKNYL